MQVALIGNTAWLDEELAIFRHMVVGLIDEQVRVVQVVPTNLSEEESVAFGQRLTWQDSPWAMLRRRRLTVLAGQLAEAGVNLIHALDGRLWEGAIDLARKLDCAAVFTAGSYMDVPQAGRLVRHLDPARMAFAATTAPIARAIEQETAGSGIIVELIPPSVTVPDNIASQQADNQQPDAQPDRTVSPLCAVITGNGRHDNAYEALLSALPVVLQQFPQTQFFMDGMGGEQHQLWQAARRLELLSNLSLVPRKLGHRELLLRADVLLQPQALGRSRSITLQAMAAGKAVIAHGDPWLDYLVADQTAWVIDQPSPQAWADHLNRLLHDPASARQLGQSARQWIKHNRSIARHIDQTRMLYHRMTGEGIKFPG